MDRRPGAPAEVVRFDWPGRWLGEGIAVPSWHFGWMLAIAECTWLKLSQNAQLWAAVGWELAMDALEKSKFLGPHLRSPVSKHDKCHGDDHGLVARLDPSFMTWGSCYLLILTWLISVSVYDISHRFRIGSSSPFWNGVFDISAPFKNLMDLIGRDEQMLFDTDSRVIFSWELWEIQAQGPALWPSWGNRWYQASNLGQAIFRHIKLIGSSILMHFWVDSLKKSVVGLPNPWLTLQLRPKRCAARYKFWGSIIYLGKLQRPHCDLTGNDG